MNQITFTDQGIDIDAALVAKALREGGVTRTVEKGEILQSSSVAYSRKARPPTS